MEEDRKQTGVYVVTEEGCLNPETGAFRHIETGIDQLGKHFNLETMVPSFAPVDSSPRKNSPVHSLRSKNRLRGSITDLKAFLRATKQAFQITQEIKKKRPDFVYYRANYLDPLPLFLRVVGIPCFIEANAIRYSSRKEYYQSLLTGIAKSFEKATYRNATHTFFLGTAGDYWKLQGTNWNNVENGIERERLSLVPPISEHRSSTTVKLCFLGHLHRHHTPEVLVEALKKVPETDSIEIHLIGGRFDELYGELSSLAKTVNHGFVENEQVTQLISSFDVGLILGGPKYASQMKLFDYASARLAVIAPDIYNLNRWFPDTVHFYREGEPDSLAEAIQELSAAPGLLRTKGNSLHSQVEECFTWEKIFEEKSTIINSYLAS